MCVAGSGHIPRQSPDAAARQQHPIDTKSDRQSRAMKSINYKSAVALASWFDMTTAEAATALHVPAACSSGHHGYPLPRWFKQ